MKEEGFTLVELAIVMVVIGLLLSGGLALGRELLRDLRVRDAIATADDLGEAVSRFKARYHYLPGDLPEAGDDLPNLPGESPCRFTRETHPKAGNGLIDAPEEATCLGVHLHAAGFIKGVGVATWFGPVEVLSLGSERAAELFPAAPESPLHWIALSGLPRTAALGIDRDRDDGDLKRGRVRAASSHLFLPL